MKTFGKLTLSLSLLASASGCVTTASMYVEKPADPYTSTVRSEGLSSSDLTGRIQLDISKEWK